MSNKIAFVMDPPERINPAKDSSFAMILAAQSKGYVPYIILRENLYLDDQQPRASGFQIKAKDTAHNFLTQNERVDLSLNEFEAVYMRCDPPVDQSYMAATFILDIAARNGARIYNAPSSLQRYNEKLYATLFPELIPPTLVSSDKERINNFVSRHGQVIIKPLDLMGGQGVYLARKPDINLDVICELETGNGTRPVIAQKFLPGIEKGDRRIILIHNKILDHVLVRFPKSGSIRGNLAAGGGHEIQDLTQTDREIAEAVRPVLAEHGVVFAGLDIIEDRLIEINHTSPTGLREIAKATGTNPAELFFCS